MKKITLSMFLLMFSLCMFAQSTINVTTSGGSYAGEKWLNITTTAGDFATQVWGQGDGTQCNGAGLINEDIMLAPGTYYVNCYDQYGDGWDGTLISVTAYGNVIGDNGGLTPDNGEDLDTSSSCDGTPEEFEASFMIVVPEAPTDTPDWYNIQWIYDNDNATGSNTSLTTVAWTSVTAYAQVYEAGLTDPAGQATGIECWIGANDTNTDPSTWPTGAWEVAVYNSDSGNNDEYKIDPVLDFSGTVYVAARWRLNNAAYVYGGYNGPWDGTTNNNIELVVNPSVANDDCDGAIALTVNADLACGTITAGTTVEATESTSDDTTCNGTNNDDVWFSFVATSENHSIEISNVTAVSGTSTDMYFEVLDGSCGSLTSLLCSDPNTGTVTGLTVSNTYLVRVYSYSTTSTQTFDICVGTPPPPPANDDCANAIVLNESTDFNCNNTVSGTTVSAFASAEDDCSTTNKDVWYILTASQTNTYKFLVTETQDYGTSSTYVSVFEGSCGALTQVGTTCFNTNLNVGLTSGNTYYVSVRSTSTTAGVDFDLCASPYPPAPANDDCAGAITLTESANDGSCANTVSGTTVSSTASTEDDCSTTNNDVWYAITAAETNTYSFTVTETEDFGSSSTYVSVFEGSCGALTQVGTSCTSSNVSVDLTSETTYYVNVRSTSTTEGVNFDLCAYPFPSPPANDECADAIGLTVNADFDCTVVTSGTIQSATDSGVTGSTCGGTANDDVWYSFTAASTDQRVSLINLTGSTTDMYIAIYDSTLGCGSLGAAFSCSDPQSVDLTGLTVGVVYYVQVYTYAGTSNQTSSFDICVGTPPPPPTNDDCANATAITTFNNGDTQDASGATNNTGFISDCASGMNDGVWYTFNVVDAGTIDIAISNVTGWDPEVAVYSGSCGAFTCTVSADSGGSGVGESVSFTATASTQYWVNVGYYSGTSDSSEGPFTIDVSTTDTTTLSLDELSFNNFKYFPNPVEGTLSLRAQDNMQNVAVYNMLGQEVINISPNAMSNDLDMSALSRGTYFVKVSINGAVENFKIIKQ